MIGGLPCGARCSHGGVCTLDQRHDGLHDTGYCTYSDAEKLTKAAGDEVFRSKDPGWWWWLPLLTPDNSGGPS